MDPWMVKNVYPCGPLDGGRGLSMWTTGWWGRLAHVDHGMVGKTYPHEPLDGERVLPMSPLDGGDC